MNYSSFESAAKNLLFEVKILLIHQVGLRQASRFSNLQNLKLHLGCGAKIKDGWVNIDLDKNAELRLNLRKSLPFDNNICQLDSIFLVLTLHQQEKLQSLDIN